MGETRRSGSCPTGGRGRKRRGKASAVDRFVPGGVCIAGFLDRSEPFANVVSPHPADHRCDPVPSRLGDREGGERDGLEPERGAAAERLTRRAMPNGVETTPYARAQRSGRERRPRNTTFR